jgi:hypothetical protein
MVTCVLPSIRVLADVAVVKPDGSVKLVESMFSTKTDLTGPPAVVASRIHPTKGAAFLSILEERGERQVTAAAGLAAGMYRVDPEIEIHVNGGGGIVRRNFSELAHASRELVEKGSCDGVVSTIQLDGFDPGYEPVLRLQHETCLLVFAALPPLVTQTDRERAAYFDLERFGAELISRLNVPCTWDDRDVFVIAAPGHKVEGPLRAYLGSYWDTERRGATTKGFWSRLRGRTRS